MACKPLSGTYTFDGSGAVKRFVITTSVNQVSTAKIKFEAAKTPVTPEWRPYSVPTAFKKIAER